MSQTQNGNLKSIRPIFDITLFTEEVQRSKLINNHEFFYIEDSRLKFGDLDVLRSKVANNVLDVVYFHPLPLTLKAVINYIDKYIKFGGDYPLFDLGGNVIDFENGYKMNELIPEEVNYDRSPIRWRQVNGSQRYQDDSNNPILSHIGSIQQLDPSINFNDGNQEGDEILDDIILELTQQVEDLENLIETGEDILEVVEYGDISDYISTKTLVELPEGFEGNKPITWQQLGGITYDDQKKNTTYQKKIMYFDDGGDNLAQRLISGDYLLDIIINYRLDIHGRKPVKWRQFEGSEEYKDEDYKDVLSEINVTDRDFSVNFDDGLGRIFKINYENGNGEKIPITWNGFHVTTGDLAEYTASLRIHAIPGFIRFGKLFIIEISEDSIIVYPISSDIQEYLIISCKVVCKNSTSSLS